MNKLTPMQVMNMNRKARRHIGKVYGVKIPGIEAVKRSIDKK